MKDDADHVAWTTWPDAVKRDMVVIAHKVEKYVYVGTYVFVCVLNLRKKYS